MSGLRKRHAGFFVTVPRQTIRDRQLTFKDRGILAFILDMPEGWEPSIDRLAAESDGDGRSAVASSLRRLREHGYYRLEQRRFPNGTFVLAPSVSPVRVQEWADQHAEYEGKPVPLVQQEDGSFRVLHKDGSLTFDDFGGVRDDPELDARNERPAQTPRSEPESGYPYPVDPDTVQPTTGNRHAKKEPSLEPSLRSGSSSSETAAPPSDVQGRRADVEELCTLMADLVAANTGRPRAVNKSWRDAARLLLDRDKRDLEKAKNLMRWAANDEFWRSNILSMPKFRQQYDQLRLRALAEYRRKHPESGPGVSRTDQAVGAAMRRTQLLREAEDRGMSAAQAVAYAQQVMTAEAQASHGNTLAAIGGGV